MTMMRGWGDKRSDVQFQIQGQKDDDDERDLKRDDKTARLPEFLLYYVHR